MLNTMPFNMVHDIIWSGGQSIIIGISCFSLFIHNDFLTDIWSFENPLEIWNIKQSVLEMLASG